jgi:hypothetical protein
VETRTVFGRIQILSEIFLFYQHFNLLLILCKKILSSLHEHSFKNEQYIIEIREDTGWAAYLEFLYPNEETLEYMNNMKVVMKLQEAGDKLIKPREVDHWAYFANLKDRQDFAIYVTDKGFKIKETSLTGKGDLRYSLNFSRVDKVHIASISTITLDLRRKAKVNNGNYDGWETLVIK